MLTRTHFRTLKHVAQYSPLLSEAVKRQIQSMPPQQANLKSRFPPDQLPLSELPQFINGTYKLDVPVYTVWGACEDVRVLEGFRSGNYRVPNLHIIDEANSRLLDIGGIKLRLLGLGGAVVMHKLFDNGEGKTTIAGGQGTMWTTLLQMGELVDTANRVYDPTETRVFVTHASPAREGLLNQLSVTLKADFSISAGLHFRYGSSYNEFSVNPTLDHYRGKLAASKASFNDVWETVKSEVEPAVAQNEAQKILLANALDLVSKMPTVANGGNPFGGSVPGQGAGGQVDESAFKNMWNFNLADAAFGYLVLEVEAGRIGTEMRAQGFNFAHRGATGQKMAGPIPQPAVNNVGVPTAGGPAQQIQNRGPPNTQMPPAQPQAPPQQAAASQQANKPPTQPARQMPAPAPAPPVVQGKPIMPALVAQTPAALQNESAKSAASSAPAPTNGTTAESKTPASAPQAQPPTKPASPAVEKKPSTGLFIHNLESEDQVREVFPEEDRQNITKIERHGKTNHVVHFTSHDTARLALDRQPLDHKQGRGQTNFGPGQPRKPNIKWYDDRGGPRQFSRDGPHSGQGGQVGQQGGAGTWGTGVRGGAQGAGQRGGYQSGASDSEGGRGRGGFAGRGGRGGRGGERGGRGGRGRGGPSKGAEDGIPAPTAKPAGETAS